MTNEEAKIELLKGQQNVYENVGYASKPLADEEQSEAHRALNGTLDSFHSVVIKRLDELQQTIDKIRLVMADDNSSIKKQVGKHLNATEATLQLADHVAKELAEIEKSLNGE